MKMTWHVQLANNARLIIEDGDVVTQRHITTQRKKLLAHLKSIGYADVVRCFGVLKQANKEEKENV